MSIIHEALKKAEREREPRPTGLPLYGGVRTARRRWRRRLTTGMLIGLTTVGAVSTWLWLQPHAGDPPVRTVRPMAQGSPAMALEGEDQTAPQTLVTHPLPIPRPLAGRRHRTRTSSHLPPPPPTLALEAQVTAQATFERARAAESKGQWEEAKSYYRQALTLNPTLVEARNNLGTLYVRQQQLTAAIDEFRAAIRTRP